MPWDALSEHMTNMLEKYMSPHQKHCNGHGECGSALKDVACGMWIPLCAAGQQNVTPPIADCPQRFLLAARVHDSRQHQ